MHIRAILILSILGLLITTRFRVCRTVHTEMNKAKGIDVNFVGINMDELWPFPETISKADPYVGELELKLTSNQENISL